MNHKYKINEDLYIGNTNKQLKDLLNGDTLPIGAIVNYDGSTVPEGYESVGNDYSTNEINTGQTWIDGKPIYRKVLSTVGLAGGTKKSINYNITNPDKIWIVSSFVYSATRVVTLPMIGYDGDLSQKADVWVEKRENAVKLYSNGGWGNDWTFYIIINYTKTTD